MDWKYYIPHLWDEDRQVWEDVYLLPANDIGYDGEALWLTVDALGNVDNPEHDLERVEALQKLGNSDYYIEDADMLVKAEDFSKAELLDWVHIWLQQQGFSVSNLIEAPEAEFYGKAAHADLMANWRDLQRDS